MEQGNSVVAIEHNLDVIKTADHIFYLDLDPGGHPQGAPHDRRAGGSEQPGQAGGRSRAEVGCGLTTNEAVGQPIEKRRAPGGGVRGREDVAQAGGGGCSRRELYRPVPVPNHDNFST